MVVKNILHYYSAGDMKNQARDTFPNFQKTQKTFLKPLLDGCCIWQIGVKFGTLKFLVFYFQTQRKNVVCLSRKIQLMVNIYLTIQPWIEPPILNEQSKLVKMWLSDRESDIHIYIYI